MLVNLVAHDEHTFLHADIAERFGFFGRIHGTRRIAWSVEDKEPGSWSNGCAQLVRGNLEFRFISGFDDNGFCAGQLHHFGITEPIRGRDDHFISFFARSKNNVETGMFATAGDNYLGGLVTEPVFTLKFVGDRLPQFWYATGGCVFGKPLV